MPFEDYYKKPSTTRESVITLQEFAREVGVCAKTLTARFKDTGQGLVVILKRRNRKYYSHRLLQGWHYNNYGITIDPTEEEHPDKHAQEQLCTLYAFAQDKDVSCGIVTYKFKMTGGGIKPKHNHDRSVLYSYNELDLWWLSLEDS